jgi:predicted amidohydrolase
VNPEPLNREPLNPEPLDPASPGEPMRIACAQLEARDLSDAPAALEAALAAVAAAGRAGARLCVLPEATYPAYVLGSAAAARDVIAAGPDPQAAFAVAAREAGCAVVVGLVLEAAGVRGLENAAVLIDATGTVRSRTAKRFLWHFDRAWFVAGRESPVHQLEGQTGQTSRTGVGMLVCADARLPEIGVALAGQGARIIANPTAWVTSMPPPEGTNSQAEFLWRVRALENHVVGVAATKVGTEADTVIYAGRSQIVGADGCVIAVASATAPELLVADVDVPDRALARPPVTAPPAGAAVRPVLRPGFVQVAVLTDDNLLEHLDAHAIDLAVGPGGVLLNGDAAVATFSDDDLLDPRGARAAALAGNEFIVWIARRVSSPLVEAVARTRALENRVFVLLWRPSEDGGPCVIDPGGTVVARAARPRFAVQAACLRAEAATKTMAPGSDAWDAVAQL